MKNNGNNASTYGSAAATRFNPQKIIQLILCEIKRNKQLYFLVSVPFIYILVFKYYPMLGVQIAFRNYTHTGGIWGSQWVGLKNFIRFFKYPKCWNIIANTLCISLYSMAISIPFPIVLAICLDYCRKNTLRKTVQMISYLPHFLSVVIIVGIMNLILDNRIGIVNNIISVLFGRKVNFLGKSEYFRSLFVWSGVWQNVGWNSILYVAALSGVDPQIHQAAIIDGASKFRRVWHIDLPGIRPTIIVLLIMNLGHIISVGFDKTFLMQNPTNLKVSEVLSTYEYKTGMGGISPNYSYASAIGFMTSVVNFILIIVSNKISNKITNEGLW